MQATTDLIKYLPAGVSDQLPVFNIWFDVGSISLNPAQDSKDLSEKLIHPILIYNTDRRSLIKKTYQVHNHLHFNIPLICYKFPVSQYTCDG